MNEPTKSLCEKIALTDYRDRKIFINPEDDTDFIRQLLVEETEPANAVLLQQGRERVVKIPHEQGASGDVPAHDFVVKTYGAHGFLRNFFESKEKGSKAKRAFLAAQILQEHGVGTPAPIGFSERYERGHLREARLITEFVPDLSNFRDELFRIYSENPDCETLINLMQTVADACRAFHDCGIIHRDLGNQNIGLKKMPDGSWRVLFLDLDRVRIFPAGTLSWAQRGADLARIDLPSDLRRVFHLLYFQSYWPTADFSEAEARARKSFARHTALRPWRHPIREWKIRRKERLAAAANANCGENKILPFGKELWIWDGRSEQAIPAYASRERRAFRSVRNILLSAKEILLRGRKIWKNYKEISGKSFAVPVDFSKTFGVALEADSASWKTQIHFLEKLENGGEKLPVLLRAYHHKGRAHWDFLCEKAAELSARGNAVALALVQDRAAIRSPKSWREMVFSVVEKTHAFTEFYEVGHATNRGKWGVWDFRDYTEKLLPAAIEAKRAFPQIKLTGPACIDFDLHSLPAILSCVPAGTFSSLSQHLYVDRRGAPENFQGKFDLVEKCALHRAFAKIYGFSDEKIIVSETNWPLLGAGVWGPVDSPAEARGPWETRPAAPWSSEPPRVSEADAAKFGVRYWLLAVASGHVSRVYWWRLVHRGFGLVDDSDPKNPRPLAAFFAFQKMLSALAGTRFERRIFPENFAGKTDVPAEEFCLEFSRADGSRFRVSWTKETELKIKPCDA